MKKVVTYGLLKIYSMGSLIVNYTMWALVNESTNL